MSFAASIKAFEEKAVLAANKSVSNAFEFLGSTSVVLTQDINIGGYSDGDIANNWYVSIGAPIIAAPNSPDKSGIASLSRIKAFYSTNSFYRKDNTVYLTNVMNYSYRANFVGWPRGPGTNGWVWTNNIQPYGFIGKAINSLKGKYM